MNSGSFEQLFLLSLDNWVNALLRLFKGFLLTEICDEAYCRKPLGLNHDEDHSTLFEAVVEEVQHSDHTGIVEA